MPELSELAGRFLGADTAERLRIAADDTNAAELSALLGADAFAELRALADRVDDQHLAFGGPPNLLFAPGIMGSLLRSRTRGGVWWIDVRSRNHLDNLRLAPDGQRDAEPSDDVVSFAVDMSYEPFLAATLRSDEFTHSAFDYDWRKPFDASTDRLRDRIVGMHQEGGERVHLVGHSMGGLALRTALMRHDELWDHVDRIVFVGTPHFGSPAISGYLKGHFRGFNLMALLGRYISRETFRSMWGALSLLPAPVGVYPGTRPGDHGPGADGAYPHPTSNFDLYDAEAWELDLDGQATQRLQVVLDGASAWHHEMWDWHKTLSPERRERMAVIAGVGFKTLFRLVRRQGLLSLFSKMDKVSDRVPGDVHRDGDGRVPLASAVLDDVRTVRYVKGEHGGLPSIPAVYADIFRFLADKPGEPMQLPDTPAGALQPHLGDDSAVDSPALTAPALQAAAGDDPGYLDFDDPDEGDLDVLDARVEAGEVPDFRQVRLL